MPRGERAGSDYQNLGTTQRIFDENSVSQIIEPFDPLAGWPDGCDALVRSSPANAVQRAAIQRC